MCVNLSIMFLLFPIDRRNIKLKFPFEQNFTKHPEDLISLRKKHSLISTQILIK